MNRRSRARLDPRGHFRRVCFDSKFPVKLVTGTGSSFDPTNSCAAVSLVSHLRIFRAIRREQSYRPFGPAKFILLGLVFNEGNACLSSRESEKNLSRLRFKSLSRHEKRSIRCNVRIF